jgi:hypothetical protein
MQITYLAVVGVLRDLHAQPRTMQRFREYTARMIGGGGDIVLPIGVANPMATDHALALAAVFAGSAPRLSGTALADARAAIDRLGDDPPYPAVFAALYGDEAARELGYAGWACKRARVSRWRPRTGWRKGATRWPRCA